jgi:hypothetical protein
MDDDVTVETNVIDTSATVDTSAAVDASPADEPVAVVPPGRSRLAVVMVIGAGLLLVAAVVFGVLGFRAQSEASAQRDQAKTAVAHRRVLSASAHRVDNDRAELESQMDALPGKYDAIGSAENDLVDSRDKYIDIANQAVELFNNGDVAGSVAVLQGNGAAALDDLNAKKTAAQQAVQNAEDALHQVEEGL